MEWYTYIIIIVAIIALYFLISLVIYFLAKKAQKKVIQEIEAVIPKERERFEMAKTFYNKMVEDGRHLPKNMIDVTNEIESLFQKVPVEIMEVKPKDDFVIMYYKKYVEEKGLKNKYPEYYAVLDKILYFDNKDPDLPYRAYNRAALKYNSTINITLFNIFTRRFPKAGVL